MASHVKKPFAAMIIIVLILSSCTSTRYSTQFTEVPNSRQLLDSSYRCVVHRLPSARNRELIVSFERVTRYEYQELKKEIKEMDNKQTRGAGWGTMLTGAVLGGAIALGGTDEDGFYREPNPEAGKGILIGGLILGGILAIIPDAKDEVSSSISRQIEEDNEAINGEDTVFTVWSNIHPGKEIIRSLKDDEIELDVMTDLSLDYIENQDSIQVYFKSHWDENLTYTVDFRASDYLKRYLNTKGVADSISLYQAPTTNSPVIGHLYKDVNLEFVEEQERWYKVKWNQRTVYIKSDRIDYFFADE